MTAVYEIMKVIAENERVKQKNVHAVLSQKH